MALLRHGTRVAYYGTLILGAFIASAQAQTTNPNPTSDQYGHFGIGTTAPNPSSMLDIASNDAGILLPRLTSAQRGAIPSPALSLMLFNTDANDFQYYSGTGMFSGWDVFITTANANGYAWQLTGNSATNPATNFLGTTDAVDLTFRTNNAERMRIASGGNVGIGTTAPNASAALDVTSTGGGMLVPRMTGAQRDLISGPALSLMLFNTDANDFQYYSGTGMFSGWDAFITTANANSYTWQLTGNSGTNAATNFLGTTDGVDLAFRTDNTERMRISSSGNVGIGTAPSTDVVNVAGNINTSTQYNIGGNRILANDGTDNLFVGVGSGAANTGSSNTFLGKDAGGLNTTGSQNTFLGNAAGNDNATPGSSNTYIGYNADGAANLTNATAIGANATVSQDNSLVLGNNANVGVGTSTPMVSMDINGGAAIQAATADFATSAVGAGTGANPRVLSLTVGNRSYFRISSDGAAVGPLLQGFPTIRRVDLSNGSQVGQVLVIECISNGNSFRIVDNANTNVDGLGFNTLDDNDTMMLIWNGSTWLEVSRSAN